MNKVLRIPMLLFLALAGLAAHAANYTHTFTEGDINAVGNVTLSGSAWDVSAEWNSSAYFGWDKNYGKGIQLGSSKKSAKSIVLKSSAFDGNISRVVVNASTAKDAKATITVAVGGFSGQNDLKMEATDYSFEPNATGDVVITLSQPSTQKALYVKSIQVTYSSSTNALAAPTIDGTTPFLGTTLVTLTATEDATIHYTTNGEEPTTASQQYAGPFTLTASATVKAIASDGTKTSDVIAKEFTAAVETSDIDDFKQQTDKTVANLALNNARVVFADASGRYAYVQDETGAICFYNTGLGLKTGQTLNGSVAGTLVIYYALPEFTANALTSTDKLTLTDGDPVAPSVLSIAEAKSNANVCRLVQISGVKLDSIGKNLYASLNGDTIQVYDTFKTLAQTQLPASSEGNTVTGILVPHGKGFEFCPTTIGGFVTTSVKRAELLADDTDAPLYNLSGQRVGKSFKGIVIRKGRKHLQ